jgi:hypothetical protein
LSSTIASSQTSPHKVSDEPIEIFFSYSHSDEKFRLELVKHLSLLQRQGVITNWYDRKIIAGDEFNDVIAHRLETASVILFLVSADFLASNYCYDIEVKLAMKRHESGEARVIPVILRPVLWTTAPFAKLMALPRDAKPVIKWRPRDDAYKNITEGVAAAIDAVKAGKQLNKSTAPALRRITIYEVDGATVGGSSALGTASDILAFERDDLLLRPGRKVTPQTLHGLIFPKSGEGANHFIINPGDGQTEGTDMVPGSQELIDYFDTSLSLKADLHRVNLSAYEADRMIPEELSGTALGRNLLSQDCVLKRLAASFLHPDFPIGKEYWSRVYAESRRLLGSSRWPFRSFQKVSMFPLKAGVYDEDGDNYTDDNPFDIPRGHFGLFIVDGEIDVKCEQDLVAQEHDLSNSASIPKDIQEILDTICIEAFREIVLPKIKDEINQGEHFTELRRIFGAQVLASWLKRHTVGQNSNLGRFIDSGEPTKAGLTIVDISPFRDRQRKKATSWRISDRPIVAHATPNAEAFKIPENVEFYAQYVRLFKDGVFRCARSEEGDAPGQRMIRVYFSGAIQFQSLCAMLSPGRSLVRPLEASDGSGSSAIVSWTAATRTYLGP